MASASNEKNGGGGGSMDPVVRRIQENHIGDKYQLVRKLGAGGFGQVYLGRDVDTGQEVAIKLEHCMSEPYLRNEVWIYQDLAGETGFPRVHWYGELHDFTFLVLELLGPNLEDLLQYCGGRFSLKTTLMLADQLLRRFEVFHSHRYLHRDIAPRNFLLGTGHLGNVVYVTDLGLTVLRHPQDDSPVCSATRDQPVRPTQVEGTSRYASINAHLGGAISLCDDLEALGYVLVYFRRGKLPWQDVEAQGTVEDEQNLRVFEMKRAISVEELCEGLPAEFAKYMTYVHELKQRDRPDHRYLRKLFSDLFRRQGFENDNVYDWTIREFLRLETPPEAQQSTVPGIMGGNKGNITTQSDVSTQEATGAIQSARAVKVDKRKASASEVKPEKPPRKPASSGPKRSRKTAERYARRR